jgi:hypothetical protein
MMRSQTLFAAITQEAGQALPLADLVRQSVYRRLAGYGDINDAERLFQCSCRRSNGSRNRARTWSCAPMPPFAKPDLYEALEALGVAP